MGILSFFIFLPLKARNFGVFIEDTPVSFFVFLCLFYRLVLQSAV